jgi:hypothetical protein
MPYRNGIQSTSTFDGQLEILATKQKNRHFYACGLIWGNAGFGLSSHALSRHVLTNIL